MNRRVLVAFPLLLVTSLLGTAGFGYVFLATFKQGDCDGGCNSGTLLLYLLAIFALSVLVSAVVWWRTRRTIRSLLVVAAALLGGFALSAGALYAYQVRQSAVGGSASVLRANQDYSHVLVAVRDLPALNIVAGQRCIFSTVDCDAQPPHLAAVCGPQGETLLRQPDWSGFERRPQEDHPVPAPRAVIDFPHSCPRR